MKKLFAIGFLLLLCLNGVGFYVFYAAQLVRVKNEAREKLKALPETQLNILYLSASDYEDALVEENELRIGGRMFDVARIETVGSSLKICGLFDPKEDNLGAFLDHFVSSPISKELPPVVVQFLVLIFIATSAILLPIRPWKGVSCHILFFSLLPFVHTESVSPPPECPPHLF